MRKKHPAIVVYEDLWQSIVDNPDDTSLIPCGTGDIVGRARFEAGLRKAGVEYPENIVHFWEWWEEIGGPKTAKRLTRKFRKRAK